MKYTGTYVKGKHGLLWESLLTRKERDQCHRLSLLTSAVNYSMHNLFHFYMNVLLRLSHSFFSGKQNGRRRTDGRKISEGKKKRKRGDWRKNECRKKFKKS